MNKITHPQRFQGSLKKKNYFEGWYYKQVSSISGRTVSFIPGISTNHEDPHAFVQVITSPPVTTYYYRFPLDSFSYTDHPFSITIHQNHFSENRLRVDLSEGDHFFKGELNFDHLTPISRTLFTPNIMGFFAYVPNMSCNHGVISMNHYVQGKIESADESLIFSKDFGYLEKDWGRSFPERYIWLQGNHFPNEKDSLIVSLATIPFPLKSFMGHIANLHVDNKEYRFATYNGSKINYAIANKDTVHLELQRKDLRLEVNGCLSDSGILKAPILGKMSHTIKEGLSGSISYILRNKDQILHQSVSAYSGIEVVSW